jgi:hypothetical protein
MSLSEGTMGDRRGKENVRELKILKQPIFFFSFIIHMCIQGLGHFSPQPPPLPYHPLRPLLLPPPPQYPAETILPLFLILL